MVTAVRVFIRFAVVLFAWLGFTSAGFGHRLDEYLQATLVEIEPEAIRLQIILSPGVSVAEDVLGAIDRDHDGVISTNEFTRYAELVKGELGARLDGKLLVLKLAGSTWPTVQELRSGTGVFQMELTFAAGALAIGPHRFTLANRHLPKVSVYLFNAAKPKSRFIQIRKQKRNENQSEGEIEFSYRP